MNKDNTPVEIDEVKLQETIARVVSGEGSENDKKFISDLEKLLGEPIIAGKLKTLGEKIKANKLAMEKVKLEAGTKLAENEADYQRKLKELNNLQFETERKARARQIKMRLVWGFVALGIVTLVTKIFGIEIGLFTFAVFVIIFYALKDR